MSKDLSKPWKPVGGEVETGQALSKVLDAVTALGDKFSSLEERLSIVERNAAATPQFVPMGKPKMNLRNIHSDGEQTGGGNTLPVGKDGVLRPGFKQEWPEGTLVKIRPESEVGKILTQKNYNLDTLIGVVHALHYVKDDGTAKYRVEFPGITRGSRGDGFWNTDLIAA